MFTEIFNKIINTNKEEELEEIKHYIETLKLSYTTIDLFNAIIDKLIELRFKDAKKKNFTPFVSIKRVNYDVIEKVVNSIDNKMIYECLDAKKERDILYCLLSKISEKTNLTLIENILTDYKEKNATSVVLITDLLI